jgi:nitrite reductase/ring-hydroxylating ferredoxin subunit
MNDDRGKDEGSVGLDDRPAGDSEMITRPPDGRPMEDQPQWRQDFPVDWPQDTYVARRDFAKFMVLTSAAFTIGQLWIGAQNSWRKSRGEPQIVRIASLASLPIGGSLVFQYPGPHDDCLLIRTSEDVVLAYSQKCTHLSCAVVPDVAGGVIRCPCHEGYFDLATGRNIAGPPPRPLPRITLDIRGDDIYATGVELTTV